MGILALMGALLVNGWAAGSTGYWDPSPEGQSLDPQTREVLRRVDAPLRLTMFAPPDAGPQRRLLERYRLAQPHIELRFVDPDVRPSEAERYRIQAYGTIVVEYGRRRENALAPTEQEITGAIVRVLRTHRSAVCFTQGHGEGDLENQDAGGLSAWARVLQDNGVEVRTVGRLDAAALEGCQAVVVLPATGDFGAVEIAALRTVMDRGGGLLVGAGVETALVRPPALSRFLSEWGLSVDGAPVLDLARGLATDPRTFLVPDLAVHPSTAGVPGLLFANAAAVRAEGEDTAVLASSSPQSFVDGTGDGVYETGTADRRGPFPVVAVGERLVRPATADSVVRSRVALLGDGRMFTNARFLEAGNRLLAVKLVDWLTVSPEVVTIAWRPPEANRLVLTRAEERYMIFVCVVVVPVVLAALGALSWLWRRRSC